MYRSLLWTVLVMSACDSSPDHPAQVDFGANDLSQAPGSDLSQGKPDLSQSGGGAACSTGTLFAGNPSYNGDPLDRPTSGTGILADPPLQWQTMVFDGTHLYTRQEGEIWAVDLSAAHPVETLIAGKNDPANFAYKDGACATARFAQVRGLAALPDGSLVVADYSGNGILHITNPNGANCNVEYWAGNATASADLDITQYPNEGDSDGMGSAVKLRGPSALTSDGAGNLYFFDKDNGKIKKIDATHAVSTLAKLPANGPGRLTNMTVLGGAVYGVGTDGASAHVIRVDTQTGAVTTVKSGRGDAFPPLDSVVSPTVAGISNDGTNLYIAGNGYLWKLTPAGQLTVLAGTGDSLDFPSGYDPAQPHPADKLVLPITQGSGEPGSGALYHITHHDGAVYFRGHAAGTAAFVERISCP